MPIKRSPTGTARNPRWSETKTGGSDRAARLQFLSVDQNVPFRMESTVRAPFAHTLAGGTPLPRALQLTVAPLAATHDGSKPPVDDQSGVVTSNVLPPM